MPLTRAHIRRSAYGRPLADSWTVPALRQTVKVVVRSARAPQRRSARVSLAPRFFLCLKEKGPRADPREPENGKPPSSGGEQPGKDTG